jgi:hypothetical protein
MMKLYEEK